MEFHGIIVNKSLKDEAVLKNWPVIKEVKDDDWLLCTVSVKEAELDEFIKEVQENMADGPWYAHFYNEDGSRLVVVYKEKVFEATKDKRFWDEIIAYGKTLNIPAEQLDFVPNTFTDEKQAGKI